MIRIDGSFGEGGGQIIRTSVSLAAITGQSVEVLNVRARRTKPGLQPQHLLAVRSAGELCAAQLDGAAIGSTHFTFRPGSSVAPGDYRFDIGTAGATPLVFQTLFLPLALAGGESRLTISGGTHVPHSPAIEYLQALYLPLLSLAGPNASLEYGPAGFYPQGGGQIRAVISPSTRPDPLILEDRGNLHTLVAFVVASRLPEHVIDRGAATIEKYMKGIGRRVTVERRDRGEGARSTGAAVVLAAHCGSGMAGFTSLGELGKPMEKVAEAACDQFLAWWKTGAAVDEHLADQLVLPLSLAEGESRWTTPVVTDHLRTVLHVVERFLPIRHTLEEHNGIATVTLHGAKP